MDEINRLIICGVLPWAVLISSDSLLNAGTDGHAKNFSYIYLNLICFSTANTFRTWLCSRNKRQHTDYEFWIGTKIVLSLLSLHIDLVRAGKWRDASNHLYDIGNEKICFRNWDILVRNHPALSVLDIATSRLAKPFLAARQILECGGDARFWLRYMHTSRGFGEKWNSE